MQDYLKTSVQERKLLVKKIGSLSDRVNEAHVRRNSVSPDKLSSDKAEVGTQCAIAQDTKMAETLAGMNVSKATIDKLEDVLSNNEEVKAKLMGMILTTTDEAKNSSEDNGGDTDSLPDPADLIEVELIQPRIGFRISELGKSLSPDADGDDKDR